VPEILDHAPDGGDRHRPQRAGQPVVTDFAGSAYSADLDGKNKDNFLSSRGNLTVAYAEMQERVPRA
jgi:hypothetical protein